MNCEAAIDLIGALVDREISAEERRTLEEHLHECPACRATLEAFQSQDHELRQTFEPRRQAVRELVGAVNASLAPSRPRGNSWSDRWGPGLMLAGSLAAAVAVITALAWRPHTDTRSVRPDEGSAVRKDAGDSPDWLMPRPREKAPVAKSLKVGEELQTKPGERLRVMLPDDSVLFVNQQTSLRVDSERSVDLSAGSVYLEVAPKRTDQRPTFVVKTPRRRVKAYGTRFAVSADQAGSEVLVTQGTVLVSGVDKPIRAGQWLDPLSEIPKPAPRSTHLLEWTRDLVAAAESPLVPGSSYSGGALIAVDSDGQQAKLSLRKYHVDVHVEDGFARTTIDQTYFNHHPWRLEGTFYFPLPPDASLSRLAMYVDGNLMEGGMAERDYARSVYQRIVQSQKDPALLEWVDGSTFKMRVFPLEGRQEKRIILSYTQRLSTLYGKTGYRFPAGHNLQLVNEWSFHARVKNAAGLSASSPTHPSMTIGRENGDLVLNDRDRAVKVDRDVVLELSNPHDPDWDGERIRFAKTEHEKHTYLMLRYRPWLPDLRLEPQRRDWLFLFESSADRDPLLARTQIEIIRTMLGQVGHDDTFNVVTAGTLTRFWSSASKPATPENAKAALDWLERTHLVGVLDLGEALRVSIEALARAENPHLVHVGSGLTGMGEIQDGIAKKVPDTIRYVGIGVGKRWGRTLMKQAAEKTGGLFTQINPDESVSWRASDLLATLNTPRLLDVRVQASPPRQGEAATLFLVDNPTISQGEELFAVTRVAKADPQPAGGTALPETVTVTGLLDGKPFRREVPVREVQGGADYLPRTWAKLEIDRLLPDAAHTKPAIIELSKAMYVMTPFTSLLVLENEQMYKDFNVDRGRKDHWAMYPCPQKIPVVYEPDPTLGIDARNAPKAALPNREQVLQSILVRVPPRLLVRENQSRRDEWVRTAGDLYRSALSETDEVRTQYLLGRLRELIAKQERVRARTEELDRKEDGERLSERRKLFNELRYESEVRSPWYLQHPPQFVVPTNGEHWELGLELREKERAGISFRTTQGLVPAEQLMDLARVKSDEYFSEPTVKADASKLGDYFGYTGRTVETLGFSPDGHYLTTNANRNAIGNLWDLETGKPPARVGQRWPDFRFTAQYDSNSIGTSLNRSPHNARQSLGNNNFNDWNVGLRMIVPLGYRADPANPVGDPIVYRGFVDVDALHRDPHTSRWTEAALYHRLLYTESHRLFTDLVSYAPGLSSSRADILATVEAEAAPDLRSSPGKVDPAARKLIERARQAGWRTLTLGGENGEPIIRLVFDGSGRYRFEQTLVSGLRETVICDGKLLWHLYPEIGLAARRTVSRFHRAQLANLLHFLPLPAEDIARGADLILVDERTVAIVPHPLKDAEETPDSVSYRWHLVFAADGRLAERQLVEMPSRKNWLREVYDANGLVRVLNADGKEVRKHQHKLGPAAAPVLKPDLAELVVVPMPLRDRRKVMESARLNPDYNLYQEENGCYRYVQPEEAVALLTMLSLQRHDDARLVLRHCIAERGEVKPGHLVLLASGGYNVLDEQAFHDLAARKDPAPVLRFLALVSSREYRAAESRWPLNLAGTVTPEDTFLGRLARFSDLNVRWANRPSPYLPPSIRRHDAEAALAFIRKHSRSPLALAMLVHLTYRSDNRSAWQLELAKIWGEMSDKGNDYEATYEQARALYRAGRKAEARTLFRNLYERTLKQGGLPVFDTEFYSALVEPGKADDPWMGLMLKTANQLIDRKSRPEVVLLAHQARAVGDLGAFDNLLTVPLSGIKDDRDRLETYLAAVELLTHYNQEARAEKLVLELLENKHFREIPFLWRLASRLADRLGQPSVALDRLERALDLEYRDLPEVIHLQSWRQEYKRLLDHYLSQTQTLAATDKAGALVQRTIRAADRWRAHDPEEGRIACELAGQILKRLGQEELAWEYLTAPLALQPEQATSPDNLARELNRTGDYTLAERAYAAAFRQQPGRGQLLWDRAMNLLQAGKKEQGRQVLRELAQSKENWPQLKERARWVLDRE